MKDFGGIPGSKGGRGAQQAQRKRNDPRGNAFRARGKGKGKGGRFGNRVDRQASVKVGVDWVVVEELELAQFNKLQTNKPTVEDLKWCGHLEEYDETYDSISTRTAKKLERIETKEFYNVSTTDDPVIEEMATEETGNVYATDAILAHLMACPRSVYPWDLVVQKMGDAVFIDKRDDSQFDYLTVSETAQDPPAPSDDSEALNSPDNLSLEASAINQNFTQQILKDPRDLADASQSKREEFPEANPFFDADEAAPGVAPASVAYRYRKFTFGGESPVSVVARCELHGVCTKQGRKQYMTAFALNEFDSNLSGGVEWRQKIDIQRGAVLATELKNNSCKLAKWVSQSVVAGADQVKIGFVSRAKRTDKHNHVILATQFYKPPDLATNITLQLTNIWGIIKMLADKFLALEDGKYVLMRDPNKPVVRIYSVPPNTFEEDYEEEEEDEEEGDDE
eukprot:CAMPEP_0172592234 /NCGR_PEP_ID=MMETSP1068-20121228/11135_1 /TAXON_ID=35684 /ORGANISM="Pseudopedinella elastica, Strain CCMP716" /LENGTH=450 /DNA_ID=CAMNT_0013389115 /DNA_START=1 /DNA_END=1353 /DNA_ORIENTATION=+